MGLFNHFSIGRWAETCMSFEKSAKIRCVKKAEFSRNFADAPMRLIKEVFDLHYFHFVDELGSRFFQDSIHTLVQVVWADVHHFGEVSYP